MKVEEFDYALPRTLIAQHPVEPRSASRMLYLDGKNGALRDATFSGLPGFLARGDLLVLNDTRVIKARLFGHKESGGKVEVLVERVLDDHQALAAMRASHAPKPGSRLRLADAIAATVLDRDGEFYRLRFAGEASVWDLLDRFGSVPLPPYIERPAQALDEKRYQTVYAREPGAVAAPTAGLHFDEAMLEALGEAGIATATITLHVGAGTFQPVRVEEVADHRMHKERYQVSEATVAAIEETRKRGGRVTAVGTTAMRALEAAASRGGLVAGAGETDLFITPGYRFRVVERLLTNFHLPRSTLLMLVCAFGGKENVQRAYRHAVQARYRFFSYGDAMLIERQQP
ncbi:MAG: tRNA preQ1(34) S-adenosylmethionine ribosyltransferase-isomerase QueA [Betaproteobacteria bacterium]|nr:tRNA preQ1(34) S-adenosylmethionine ribosyltransferase-isomerase QueA [Betaproteobacteria bacterium]